MKIVAIVVGVFCFLLCMYLSSHNASTKFGFASLYFLTAGAVLEVVEQIEKLKKK